MMGRFYADLNKLDHAEILKQSNQKTFATLIELHMMSSIIGSSSKQAELVSDRDGDIIMAEAISASPTVGLFKEKFNFEWFNFDDNKLSTKKTPLFSPVSPASSASRKLSVSTASPSSHFSDLSPATLGSNDNKHASDLINSHRPRTSQLILPSPPSDPLHWIWQCHMCRSRYPLSVTRRCLVDGHYYCSGVTTTTQRNVKRRKANRSCSSEFDYIGWQDWGRWNRKCKSLRAYADGEDNGPVLQGCEGCSFPSQCRYKNRPRQEKLEFSNYIDDKDIDTMLTDEAESHVSPEKQAFEDRLSKKTSDKSALVSTNLQNSTALSQITANETEAPKLEAPSEITTSAPITLIPTKRERFYLGIANSISSMNSNSIRDNSEKGKFDSTLPSVSASSTSLRIDTETRKEESQGYLGIIEATLRSALPNQSSAQYSGIRRTQSLPQNQTSASKTKTKKRLNSKTDDPEFELSTGVSQRTSQARGPTWPAISQSGLTRTNSEQSLITDLFRQVKGSSITKEKISVEKAKRAASEADIAQFLQLRNPIDTAPKLSFDHVKAWTSSPHFEEIQLTPKKIKTMTVLTPWVGVDSGSEIDDEPAKPTSEPPGITLGVDVGDKDVAVASGGGLFSFGFGRQ